MTITRWRPSRRLLMQNALIGGSGLALAASPLRALGQSAPAVVTSSRPAMPYGVQTGDVLGDRAILWSRTDRPARMLVELSTTESFKDAQKLVGPTAVEDGDFTTKLDLSVLPLGQRMFYRVQYLDLGDLQTLSEPVTGSFVTPPGGRRTVKFVWGGDVVGQGWGINPDIGGMKIYEAMRQRQPDFFVHSGDSIYADGPVQAEQKMPNGGVWKNLTTEAKSKVAETLAEFRGAYAYNLMDENLRGFNAEVAMLAQWDDHEVLNNWYWEKRLDGNERYQEKSVAVLASRAMRAFMDYMPVRQNPMERDRVYTSFPYGPTLEVFRLDMRSYRGPNSYDRQEQASHATDFLGPQQIRWLKQALLASDATWKVIAADMPIGLLVPDGKDAQGRPQFEAIANGDGPALGRELEIADLLTFISRNGIKNTVWLTADVHYTAAHHYHPDRAQYQDFAPFWEFVSGPLNAGTFGPNTLDNTFGPELVFVKAPKEGGPTNLPPSDGYQFFGEVVIDGESEAMTVNLCDMTGAVLFSQELQPEA